MLDLSSYPKDHELYDPTNNKVIGKFQDESISNEAHYIKEFVALKVNLYAYSQTDDKDGHTKCKGVKSSVVKKDAKLENYKVVKMN